MGYSLLTMWRPGSEYCKLRARSGFVLCIMDLTTLSTMQAGRLFNVNNNTRVSHNKIWQSQSKSWSRFQVLH
jgi:ABC-type antimicrobial peptide transport system permease subunit